MVLRRAWRGRTAVARRAVGVAAMAMAMAMAGCGFGDVAAHSALDSVPEHPNYEDHISLIMALHCDSCHSRRFPGSKTFRSTTYDSSTAIDGVFDSRFRIARRVIDADPSPMPPPNVPPVSRVERQTLQKWIDAGAPREGPPQPAAPLCDPANTYTYSDDALPIFETHCIRCHSVTRTTEEERNGANPVVNFDDYDSLIAELRPGETVAQAAVRLMKAGSMPADHATTPSDDEICVIEQWIEQGYLE